MNRGQPKVFLALPDKNWGGMAVVLNELLISSQSVASRDNKLNPQKRCICIASRLRRVVGNRSAC
jgi:hypothetical protein